MNLFFAFAIAILLEKNLRCKPFPASLSNFFLVNFPRFSPNILTITLSCQICFFSDGSALGSSPGGHFFLTFLFVVRIIENSCRSGEIGRRTGLKIPRPSGRVGSIPTSGINIKSTTEKTTSYLPKSYPNLRA